MLICEITGKETMPTVPFQKIAEACRTTGLSQYYLRQGCKDGTIPHIRSGSTYYINVPELLGRLSADGAAATKHGAEISDHPRGR